MMTASCDPNATALLTADKLFTAADNAAKRDAAAAKAAYDAGMQQLAGTAWFIGTKACDPPQYTFERYIVSLHSLLVGETTGATDAIKAFENENEMWDGITQPSGAPRDSAGRAAGEFMAGYPKLFQQMSNYEVALRTKYNAALIARHSPSSASCADPNIPVEYLRDLPIYFDTFAQGMQLVSSVPAGHYEAIVHLTLGDDAKVQSAQIVQSSGQQSLDEEAVREAESRHYVPEVKDCRRVASTYTYDFSVNTTHR